MICLTFIFIVCIIHAHFNPIFAEKQKLNHMGNFFTHDDFSFYVIGGI
jgi:hypothetical protein